MKTAELKVLPVSVLKPAKYNPRKKLKPGDREYKKIKDSIEEFGFADPLVVNSDMTIIGGHQRLSVAIDLGFTEVPCAVVDVDKTREKALNIALNKITGEWDEQLLADLLTDLKEADYDLDYTGFEAAEVDSLFSNIYDKKVKEDDFDVEKELKQPCFSCLGDLWMLGRHRVACGDSTDPATYEALMEGQQANLVLTDPPYNVNVEETAGKILNDNMGDQEFFEFLLSAYRCMHANLADDGSIYVWHADTEGLNFRKAFKEAGFYLSGCCIWKKNALVLGRSPYQWIHEPCLFGWKLKGKHQWYSDRKQTTVWEYDRPRSSKDHPTMKPINLMSYPIKNSTMTNGVVLDPFLGSGSTLIACCETDRVCRGIELDPKFVDCIVKRYIEWAGGKAHKAAFHTDYTFNIAEYFHFCNRLLKKEPCRGEKGAPCMIVFCAFQQIPEVIRQAEKYGFKNYIPLVFCKNYSPQVLKANMRIVGATEYALVLYRGKLPKFRNTDENGKRHMVFNWFDWFRDGKEYPKIHPSQKPVSVLKRLIEIFTDPGDVVIDPCAGSGSTLRAARELGRHSYGFEISREFYQAATEKMLKEYAG